MEQERTSKNIPAHGDTVEKARMRFDDEGGDQQRAILEATREAASQNQPAITEPENQS